MLAKKFNDFGVHVQSEKALIPKIIFENIDKEFTPEVLRAAGFSDKQLDIIASIVTEASMSALFWMLSRYHEWLTEFPETDL